MKVAGRVAGGPLDEDEAADRGHGGETDAGPGIRAARQAPAGLLVPEHLGHLDADPREPLRVVVVDDDAEVLAVEALHQSSPPRRPPPSNGSSPLSPSAFLTSVTCWVWPSVVTRWRTRWTR